MHAVLNPFPPSPMSSVVTFFHLENAQHILGTTRNKNNLRIFQPQPVRGILEKQSTLSSLWAQVEQGAKRAFSFPQHHVHREFLQFTLLLYHVMSTKCSTAHQLCTSSSRIKHGIIWLCAILLQGWKNLGYSPLVEWPRKEKANKTIAWR